jgi:hypothetical protein
MNPSHHAQVTPDDFFGGFLAALTLTLPQPQLSGTRTQMNRAFYRALKSGTAFDLRQLEIDYDPVYGLSPWFDRALTRAQRDMLVTFPNPSYETVAIQIDRTEAEEMLNDTGKHRDAYLELAKKFLEFFG